MTTTSTDGAATGGRHLPGIADAERVDTTAFRKTQTL